MKTLTCLAVRLGGFLAALIAIASVSAAEPPVQRTPNTTNTAVGVPANGEVPTWDNANNRWDFQTPPGAGGGEANTGSNLGASGYGAFNSKLGLDLRFNNIYVGTGFNITSNANVITISPGVNLTSWSSLDPSAKQDASANLTSWSALAPSAKQDASANLTSWSALAPSAKQDASANLTSWSALAPSAKQDASAVLTSLTSLTDPNANRIAMWDDTDNAFVNAVVGANLTYTHSTHTLSSAAGGSGATNIDYGSANNFFATNLQAQTVTVGSITSTNGYISLAGVATIIDVGLYLTNGGTGLSTNVATSLNSKPNISDQTYQKTNATLTQMAGLAVSNGSAVGWSGGVLANIATGTGATNIDYGSANAYTISNSLVVLNGSATNQFGKSEFTNFVWAADVKITNSLVVGATNIIGELAGKSSGGNANTNMDYGSANLWTVTNTLNIASGGVVNLSTTNLATSLNSKANAAAPALTGQGTEQDNLGALLSVGNTSYVDLNKASVTNDVAGPLTLAYATNGVDLVDKSCVVWLFNPSGASDQTLTIPLGWRTNLYSAVPTKVTNGWITRMIVSCGGPTGSTALQTNCYVSFEYYH